MAEPYNRDAYLAAWAQQLGCPPDAYSIATHLINTNRNFETAMACCFGLSWVKHSEYLRNVCKTIREAWQPNDVCTNEWLDQFVQYYITEVSPYPE